MTLVIACKSKDGIVVASDGYGAETVPGQSATGETTGNAKKIYEFNRSCLLAFGDGAKDYDLFLRDFMASYNEPITYQILHDDLKEYLSKKYGSDIYFANPIGLLLAGLDQENKQRIGMFMSQSPYGVEFHFFTGTDDYCCKGKPELANKLFEAQTNLAKNDALAVAALAKEAIVKTSKELNDVNDNVVMKLITEAGIRSIDMDNDV